MQLLSLQVHCVKQNLAIQPCNYLCKSLPEQQLIIILLEMEKESDVDEFKKKSPSKTTSDFAKQDVNYWYSYL